ncbi:PfkB family carbohydrate kinase [Candidatus Pelagibacter sp.]|nr:PfkB family carbohydrate kinase [Candidatus Pelagibacter sp.]
MISKVLTTEKLRNFYSQKKNKTISLCHGVFDLIHQGHLKHFKEIKKFSDILIVSVTSDKFAKKGDGRPYFNLADRMYVLSCLEYVDFVVESNSYSAEGIIKKIKPNFYCKGPDYKHLNKDDTKKIYIEKKAVEKNGGKLFITSDVTSSSSELINSEYIFDKKQISFLRKIKKKLDIEKVYAIFDFFKKQDVLIAGETIIDVYNHLNALNKSGKEGVLNFSESKTCTYLGGSAAVANNVSNFAKKTILLTYLGKDNHYHNFIKENLSKSIKFKFIKKKNSPTIEKKRYLDEGSNHKLFGIYKHNDSFLDKIQERYLIKEINKLSKNTLILLYDYGHGFFTKNLISKFSTKKSFKSINAQLNSSSLGYHSIHKYKSYNLVTMNESELRFEMRDRSTDLRSLIKLFAKKNKANFYLLTMGKKGAIIYNRKKSKFAFAPAFGKKIVDKVGAGDSMIPIISICLANKIDEDIALLFGSVFAAESIKFEANNYNLEKIKLIDTIKTMLKV